MLAQALTVRLKSDRARALAITGSLIGAAAYGVALLDHGVADTVLASVLLGVSPSSHRRSPRSPRFPPVPGSRAVRGVRDPGIRPPGRPPAALHSLFNPSFLPHL